MTVARTMTANRRGAADTPDTPDLASADIAAAARLATRLLGPTDRLEHTRGVARRAATLAPTVPPHDRDLLVVAAWLHDIGYSPDLEVVRFHPIDGARYLIENGWSSRVAALVAHHSGARFTADVAGLHDEMTAYPFHDDPIADALTYADQTTGPRGEPMPIHPRIANARARHPDSPSAHARHRREPYLLGAADRVEDRRQAIREAIDQGRPAEGIEVTRGGSEPN